MVSGGVDCHLNLYNINKSKIENNYRQFIYQKMGQELFRFSLNDDVEIESIAIDDSALTSESDQYQVMLVQDEDYIQTVDLEVV